MDTVDTRMHRDRCACGQKFHADAQSGPSHCEWPLEGGGELCARALCTRCARVFVVSGRLEVILCAEHMRRATIGERRDP